MIEHRLYLDVYEWSKEVQGNQESQQYFVDTTLFLMQLTTPNNMLFMLWGQQCSHGW